MWAGYQGRASAWDRSALDGYMNESAQAPALAMMPGAKVSERLFVLGEVTPRAAMQDGGALWVAAYPAESSTQRHGALAKVERAWRRQGLSPERQGEAVVARDERSQLLLAALPMPDQREVQVQVREVDAKGTAATASRELFRMHGIPEPPRNAEMMNFTSSDAAPMLCFAVRSSVSRVAGVYLGQIEAAGWSERPLGPMDGVAEGTGVVFRAYERDHHYITVAITARGRGESLVAVTVIS
jgi:hypothetical protein